MSERILLLDQPADRPSRAALLVDGVLEDLLIDAPHDDPTPGPGAITSARVERLVPGLGGAFVRLESGVNGYARETAGLRQGMDITVQVTGAAEAGKAVPVSPRVLIKGQQVILTPDAPGINVSRRIRDRDERARLCGLVEQVMATMPKASAYGVIIRSAAADAEPEDLTAELRILAHAPWSDPAHAWQVALREWCTPLPLHVYMSAPIHETYRTRSDFYVPRKIQARISVMQDTDPFDHFGVYEQIAALQSPRENLPDGGWMAIEATRALIAVDVNTAQMFGAGAPLRSNLAAARALARALRLRGLGGQITIDFAPLRKGHRKQIEDALRAGFRHDPIDTTLAGWTPLGHFELLRKRERRPLESLLGPSS